MANFLVSFHDGIRWIVVLLILIVLIKSLVGWLGKQSYTKLDRQLWMGLVNAVGIQFILGLVILIWRMIDFGFIRTHWEHAVTNIIAVGVIMYAARFKKLEDILHHRNKFFAVLASTLLIFVAVSTVNGWSF